MTEFNDGDVGSSISSMSDLGLKKKNVKRKLNIESVEQNTCCESCTLF